MSIWSKRIKEKRKEANLTLLDVSRYLGVAEATVQRYESGNIKNIPYDIICKFAELFNCSPAYIMGWENNSNTLSDNEKLLLNKYRQLNKEQQYKVIGYIENELNYIIKESTPIYRIDNKIPYVAEEEIKYNEKIKTPMVASDGDNRYVLVDKSLLDNLENERQERLKKEKEQKDKLKELQEMINKK